MCKSLFGGGPASNTVPSSGIDVEHRIVGFMNVEISHPIDHTWDQIIVATAYLESFFQRLQIIHLVPIYLPYIQIWGLKGPMCLNPRYTYNFQTKLKGDLLMRCK